MAVKRISPEELSEKMKSQDNIVILDVRAEEKYKDYHIEEPNITDLNINKEAIFKLKENENATIPDLPKDREIVVTCTTGNSATKCATILADKGYKAVVLDGGVTAWKDYLNKK